MWLKQMSIWVMIFPISRISLLTLKSLRRQLETKSLKCSRFLVAGAQTDQLLPLIAASVTELNLKLKGLKILQFRCHSLAAQAISDSLEG